MLVVPHAAASFFLFLVLYFPVGIGAGPSFTTKLLVSPILVAFVALPPWMWFLSYRDRSESASLLLSLCYANLVLVIIGYGILAITFGEGVLLMLGLVLLLHVVTISTLHRRPRVSG